VKLSVSGAKAVTAGDISISGQVEIANKDQHIATLTTKNSALDIEIYLEKGLGYIPKEQLQKEKIDIGTIAVDAAFTPIRRVSYEVEPMRVGNRTDFNKLRISLETDGVISPREALEESIRIIIHQLNAVVGFKEDIFEDESKGIREEAEDSKTGDEDDILKTKVEDLNLSVRTAKSLDTAVIRTVGGLVRKSEEDLLALSGLGDKGIQEIKRALSNYGLTLKQ
ncbi:MAG: DNA-directed RNA polymerase subunit alpha C-terminal domain-containing protein, partial [bacterium]